MARNTVANLKAQTVAAELRVRKTRAQMEGKILRAYAKGAIEYRPPARRSGYSAATDTPRAMGSRKIGGAGDAHLTPQQLKQLRAECRDNDRNNPIFKSVANRVADLTVGSGLRFKATARNAAKWNAWLEDRVERFFESGEVSGRFGSLQFQRWLAREPGPAGCAMVSLLGADAGEDEGKFQLIEAESIDGGPEYGRVAPYGVLRDGVGRLETVFTRTWPVGQLLSGSRASLRTERLDGDYVLVNENLTRVSMTLGEPALACCIEVINELFAFLQTVLTAGQMAAKIAVVTRTKSPAAMRGVMPGVTQRDTRAGVDPSNVKAVEMDDGVSVLNIQSDEDVKTVSSTHPQVQLPDYMRAMIRMAGAPCGVPLELLLMDWTGVSYSGGRVSLYFAYECAAENRDRVRRVLRKMVEWRLPAFLREFRAEFPGEPVPADWRRFRFNDPARVSLDPLKEAQANKINVDENFDTQENVQESLDNDADSVLERREFEVKEQTRRGILPAKAPGATVQGRDPAEPVGADAVGR